MDILKRVFLAVYLYPLIATGLFHRDIC